MIDPVVCVDGHSYERRNIEEWFESQAQSNKVPHVFTSPLTGEVLQSTVLFRNINLAKALARYSGEDSEMMAMPCPVLANSDKGSSALNKAVDCSIGAFKFSRWALGRNLSLADQCDIVKKQTVSADTVDWYDFIAFSAFPARITPAEKPRILFSIDKTVTSWGGLAIGFSPRAPDDIKVAEIKDYVDANCWWLDGNSWFHSPNGISVLTSWSTSKLKVGDTFGAIVPESGRICFFANGDKKLDLKDTGIPVKVGTQLFGFVALTGSCAQVRIIQDSLTDWVF